MAYEEKYHELVELSHSDNPEITIRSPMPNQSFSNSGYSNGCCYIRS